MLKVEASYFLQQHPRENPKEYMPGIMIVLMTWSVSQDPDRCTDTHAVPSNHADVQNTINK